MVYFCSPPRVLLWRTLAWYMRSRKDEGWRCGVTSLFLRSIIKLMLLKLATHGFISMVHRNGGCATNITQQNQSSSHSIQCKDDATKGEMILSRSQTVLLRPSAIIAKRSTHNHVITCNHNERYMSQVHEWTNC